MRKPVWIGLAIALLGCAGCVTPPHESFSVTAPPPVRPFAPPPPVTADQVTAENRHEMAQALFEELDREANQATVGKAR